MRLDRFEEDACIPLFMLYGTAIVASIFGAV